MTAVATKIMTKSLRNKLLRYLVKTFEYETVDAFFMVALSTSSHAAVAPHHASDLSRLLDQGLRGVRFVVGLPFFTAFFLDLAGAFLATAFFFAAGLAATFLRRFGFEALSASRVPK